MSNASPLTPLSLLNKTDDKIQLLRCANQLQPKTNEPQLLALQALIQEQNSKFATAFSSITHSLSRPPSRNSSDTNNRGPFEPVPWKLQPLTDSFQTVRHSSYHFLITMKLSPEHELLDQAIAAATLAAHLRRFRPINAITYRRYHRVTPSQQPFRKRDIPTIATTYEPLQDTTPAEPDFAGYRSTLSDISDHCQRLNAYDFDSIPLLLDTGASVSCTFNRHDFTSEIRPVQTMTLKGIASSLSIQGIGSVQYTLPNDDGSTTSVTMHDVLYVPDCPTRLICPRQLLHHLDDPDASLAVTANHVQLAFRGRTITIAYDEQLNIPIISTVAGVQSYLAYCQATNQSHIFPPSIQEQSLLIAAGIVTPNLTPEQHIKRKLHTRYDHEGYGQINAWLLDGTIDIPNAKAIARAPDPLCPICQFGKARRQSHKQHTRSITAHATKPGDGVSADQMEAAVPGLLPTNKGSPTKRRYLYANFWVDHYSSFVYVTMHETKHAAELVKSKGEFESFAARYNIKIKSIRADNGVYSASTFKISCDVQHQKLSFCGVGSHWQNGKAERTIGVIETKARTILLHAVANWPGVINDSFWPFAVRHAVNFQNCITRRRHSKSPWELFTGESPPWSLNDFRVFGCPAYVLHKELQDGNKRDKWTARSWQGCYVGFSPLHARTFALIYNPSTTHVSPQFHIVYDEHFSSVSGNSATSSADLMQSLFDIAKWASEILHPDSPSAQYFFDDYFSPPDTATSTTTSIVPPNAKRTIENITPDPSPIADAASSEPPVTVNPALATAIDHPLDITSPTLPRPEPSIPIISQSQQPLSPQPTPSFSKPYQYSALLGSPALQAWKRRRDINGNVYHCPKYIRDPTKQPDPTLQPSSQSLPDLIGIFQAVVDHGIASLPASSAPEGDSNHDPLHSFQAALSSTEDTLSQSQMLKANDREEFEKVQIPKIRGLEKLGVFQYHKMSSLPNAAQLLNSIWSYRGKRKPTGELLKHKAKICTDGSQQKFGIDFWQTYAPVVNWSTIRLVLVLASILNLYSCQVDFAQAFPQARLSDPVYLKIPQGWYVDDDNNLQKHADAKHRDREHYIQLLKNLYGCKQGARNWWKHLSKGLIARGFHPSATDNCLYIRKDCLLVLYTDDCLIFAPHNNTITTLIEDLKKDYLIGDTGSVQDFLGIRITKEADGSINMAQTGLISSILNDVGITDCKTSHTPSDQVLHPDTNGPPRREKWNYRSVIGKLNFLASNTRPDISMAVHNCARFCCNPTQLHEMAIKRICRYLLLTKDKGITMKPIADFRLNMYVDADFAGTWHKEFAHLRTSVLSRTGFLITYCGCPVTWSSKLQSEIALSTTEAEYIALSMATRQLIPLRRIMSEITNLGPINVTMNKKQPIQAFTSTLQSSNEPNMEPSIIYEDNAACIVLAETDQHKPRTKHISIKWHHFRDQIQNGNIKIQKIGHKR